jgi:hypothetical protein
LAEVDKLDLPQAFDVVPIEAVDAINRALQHEDETVRNELARVNEEIETLQRLLDGARDLEIAPGEELERRLLAFLDDWHRLDETDTRAALDAARSRAEDRVRVAHVEAGAIVAAARADADRARHASAVPSQSVFAGPPIALEAPPVFAAPAPLPPPVAVAAPAPAPADVRPSAVAPSTEVPATGALDDLLASVLAALEGGQSATSAVELLPPAGLTAGAGVSAPLDDVASARTYADVGTELGDAVDSSAAAPVSAGPVPAPRAPERSNQWRPLHYLLPMVAVVAVLALCLLLFV